MRDLTLKNQWLLRMDTGGCSVHGANTHTHTGTHGRWRSEDKFVELVLTIHFYLGFGDRIQVIRIVWPGTGVSVNGVILEEWGQVAR